MKLEVKISNRHVHLTKEDYKLLFGDEEISKRNDLSQPGEFATNQIVTIKTSKNVLTNVRLIGPLRDYTQVEISKTDAYVLGINPPVRNSGDLTDASEITIAGPLGEITRNACIIATRHIHITKEEQEKLNLGETVKVKTFGEKSTIFNNVSIRVSDNYYYELHLDTDDGNAAMLKQGDIVEIIE